MDPIVDVAGTLFEKMLKNENKLYASVWFYIFSGVIGGLCLITQIVPFRCSSSLIDSIVWNGTLSDTSLVVWLSFALILLRVIYYWIRYEILHRQNVTKDNRVFIRHVLSVEDMIDLLTSTMNLLFMVSVFLQMYNTGELFISILSTVIYLWIVYHIVTLIFVRFESKNEKIISNSFERFPDEAARGK